jgi:hypothetical protein
MAVGNVNMFKRFKALQAAIQERIEFYHGTNNAALQADIAELSARKEFQSRGHGGNHRANCHFGSVFAQHKNINSNKYQPHQGKQEIARRLSHI